MQQSSFLLKYTRKFLLNYSKHTNCKYARRSYHVAWYFYSVLELYAIIVLANTFILTMQSYLAGATKLLRSSKEDLDSQVSNQQRTRVIRCISLLMKLVDATEPNTSKQTTITRGIPIQLKVTVNTGIVRTFLPPLPLLLHLSNTVISQMCQSSVFQCCQIAIPTTVHFARISLNT